MTETLAVWCCSKCGAVYHQDFPRCPADGAEVVLALEDPLLGQQIGHYIIDRLIGEGGMGRVYIARHAHLTNKQYAIKVLLGDFATTATMRMRFTNEAESASRLSHPNLVNVIDYGCMPAGLPYIVMELVTGRPLGKLIDEGPMDPARVIRIARGVCAGLAFAHDAGVVHRDLKPDNILIVRTASGEEIPRIADFGLAVTTDPNDARLTSTGMAVGTPAYCAPEQMAGRRVDHRADLYALGMTMFEMLTGGVLPFDGTPLEIMTAKAHHDPRSVGQVAPKLAVPIELQVLIGTLIRRKSADRPDGARAVIEALDAIDLAAPPQVTPAELPAVTEPMRGRGRRPLLWTGLLGVSVAAAGGIALWQHQPATTAEVAVVAPVPAVEPPAQPAAAPPQPPPVVPDQPPAIAAPVTPPPVAPPVRQPAHQRTHHHQPREARVAMEPAPPIAPVVAVPLPPLPPAPPPPPVQLEAHLGGVDVSGSLPTAVVRRAIDRVFPAVRQCAPTGAPLAAQVRFTVDESRRPQNLRVVGAPGALTSCLANAFGGLRSEAAPDVGDAEVSVQIGFQVKP